MVRTARRCRTHTDRPHARCCTLTNHTHRAKRHQSWEGGLASLHDSGSVSAPRTTRVCASHLAVALAGAQQPVGSRRKMDTFLDFPYYDLPLSNELLPLPLVDPGAYFAAGFEKDWLENNVSKDGKLFTTSYPDIYSFAMWASISRYFAAVGINVAAEVPFQAVAQDDGTPGKNEPQPVSVYGSSDGDGFMMLWLGCRCSWPVTQLMWWQALGCQLHAWAAVVVAVLTLILQIMILDGFLSQMVGQASHPPGTTASLPKRSAC